MKPRGLGGRSRRTGRLLRAAVAIAAAASLAGCITATALPAPAPLQAGELLRVLSLGAQGSAPWVQSGALFARAQAEHWSPFVWAVNASHLISLRGDAARRLSTARALMDELRLHTQNTLAGPLVRYDREYDFAGARLRPPWYSAFANAAVAAGLMHIEQQAPDAGATGWADRYLQPAITRLAHRDEAGRLWFSLYVARELPDGHADVTNAHFFVLAVLIERRLATGTTAYDDAIHAGLDTYEAVLPTMIRDGYFAYAPSLLQVPDYGQQRAVNYAQAGCRLRPTICPVAARYEDLHRRWTGQGR